MRWSSCFAALGLTFLHRIGQSAAASSSSSDDKKAKSKPELPCTVHSPHTGSFFDLRPIALAPIDPEKKPHKDQRTSSWHARGYDYLANFTINVCAPVLEELELVVGVPKDRWRNVSAYYELDGKAYSIG